MSLPSNRMRPPSVVSDPETQLISVVLPEPFGPMSPNRSPALTERLTRLRAVKPPNRLTTPSTSSRAPAIWSVASQAPHQAQDALGREDDEGDQHDADDEQVHLGRDGDRGELLSRTQQHGADDGSDPARRAPDHRHREGVHRVVQAE